MVFFDLSNLPAASKSSCERERGLSPFSLDRDLLGDFERLFDLDLEERFLDLDLEERFFDLDFERLFDRDLLDFPSVFLPELRDLFLGVLLSDDFLPRLDERFLDLDPDLRLSRDLLLLLSLSENLRSLSEDFRSLSKYFRSLSDVFRSLSGNFGSL